MNINEVKDWIAREKSAVGKCYEDIIFGIENIIDFKDGTDIENRYFVKNAKILDKYMEKIYEIEARLDRKKKVLFFKVEDVDKNEINRLVDECKEYRRNSRNIFEKLNFCRKCECLNCVSNCKFASCNTCGQRGKVTECDKEDKEIVMFNNATTELYNSDTMVFDTVNVLTQVNILSKNSMYRVIETGGEYLILTYSREINGKENYGEVKDSEVFDYIADAYERNIDKIL